MITDVSSVTTLTVLFRRRGGGGGGESGLFRLFDGIFLFDAAFYLI